MAIAIGLHVVFVLLWVGGMIFAWSFLRPAAVEVLQPPERLQLWLGVFNRFFPWVWLSVTTILLSGLWMIFFVYQGFSHLPMYINIMFALGLLMMALFMHVFFAPYQRLKKAVAEQNWPEGGANLATIRKIVGFNSILGVITVLVAVSGRFL